METQSKNTKKRLLKKARSKFLSSNLASRLVKANPHSPLKKAYISSYYCSHAELWNEDKQGYTSHYCKKRWCSICGRIRTAQLMNEYGEELQRLKRPYFVTLTARTVTGEELPQRIEDFNKNFQTVLNYIRRKHKIKPTGIRKAECVISESDRNKFHYHFHLIVEKKSVAELIIKRWLECVKHTSPKAQDIRKADKGSHHELLKYFTKPVYSCEPGDYKKQDVMFRAMRGKRTFQSFGNVRKIKKDVKIEEEKLEIVKEEYRGTLFVWKPECTDWVNEHGELYSGYVPSKKTLALFEPKNKKNPIPI